MFKCTTTYILHIIICIQACINLYILHRFDFLKRIIFLITFVKQLIKYKFSSSIQIYGIYNDYIRTMITHIFPRIIMEYIYIRYCVRSYKSSDFLKDVLSKNYIKILKTLNNKLTI